MKRFRVHVSVADLSASIRYYSALFAAQPTVVKEDYAKWYPRMVHRHSISWLPCATRRQARSVPSGLASR
ncbi:hypothetical protein CO2235_160014 [Cupriavidus oxalaticus]|nr:hypothetical protein CO2235_160014 [Cupriavidus oxalaticus]